MNVNSQSTLLKAFMHYFGRKKIHELIFVYTDVYAEVT